MRDELSEGEFRRDPEDLALPTSAGRAEEVKSAHRPATPLFVCPSAIIWTTPCSRLVSGDPIRFDSTCTLNDSMAEISSRLASDLSR